MVISLGCCYWPSRRVSQSPDCWSSCNVRGKMRGGGKDDDEGMVSNVEGVRSLGGRETLSSMRDGICVCVAVVVLMVAVGVVVLGVAVGVAVLVIVVRVLRELFIGVVEVGCIGVIDIMVLCGVFLVEVVEGVELVVGCVARLVLWSVNGRGYFLCCFNLISVEMNGLSVGGCLFGMVIWVDFLLLECEFLMIEVVVVEAVNVVRDGFFVFSRHICLGDMMDVKVVMEVVVGVVVLVGWGWSVV